MASFATVFLFVVFAATIWDFVGADEEAAALEDHQTQLTSLQSSRQYVVATVDCYSCNSCQQVTDNTYIKNCPYNPDIRKIKKCVKYAEQYRNPVNGMNVTWVVRGCVSDKGTCAEIKKGYMYNLDIELASCTECEGDICNGVSRTLSDVFFSIFTIILVPIFGKYLLS